MDKYSSRSRLYCSVYSDNAHNAGAYHTSTYHTGAYDTVTYHTGANDTCPHHHDAAFILPSGLCGSLRRYAV